MFGKKAVPESDAARARRLLNEREALGPKIEAAVEAAVRFVAQAQAVARDFDEVGRKLGRRSRAVEEVTGDVLSVWIRARFATALPLALRDPGPHYTGVTCRGLGDWEAEYFRGVVAQVGELGSRLPQGEVAPRRD